MKKFLTALLLLTALNSFAQKGVDEMIAAEKSFAAYAVANNTVDAFLKFMDTSAVMFRNGEPYKAYEDWAKREKRPGILNWWPTYAEIASSGDWGYTCGSWTFQPQTVNDSVVASGFFFTVWQKNSNGEWKFILDVGTDQGPLQQNTTVTKLLQEKTNGNPQALLKAETDFIDAYNKKQVDANSPFVSPIRIAASEKNGMASTIHPERTRSFTPLTGHIDFSMKGSGIAPSGDLGFVYGSATLKGKKETYLRIWRHEPTGWKIALQMVRL